MNINFELYRVFYTVAKHKSITKAAEELHITQPAISKSIKNLENALNGELFKRTRKGVILTEEGKEFYNYISIAIEYINNAEHKFTELINLESGTIKIGINTTLTKLFLLPFIEEFHKLYSKIRIELTPGLTSELITKLKNGLLDIVIINLNKENYGQDLQIIKCKKIHDTFYVGKSLKELTTKNLSLKNLHEYPLILPAKNSNSRKFIDNFAKENEVTLTPNIELASYSLISEFTKIGFGIGFGTKEFITKEIKEKQLFILNLKEKIPTREIGIVLTKNSIPNFSTKKLIELITKK